MGKLTNSYVCSYTNDSLLNETIGNYFDAIVERFPENEAVVFCHQGIRRTYKEYQFDANALAAGLLKTGIQPGDRVGIWGPNSYAWAVTQIATAKIGAILVCINPAYRLYELEYALNKVECRALITDTVFKNSHYLEMLCELAPELAQAEPGKLSAKKLPYLESVIRMGEAKTPGMLNFTDICGMGTEQEYAALQALQKQLQGDDAINIQFTSGTTGHPKGATLSHSSILNNALALGRGMRFSDQDRLCVPVPLYHAFGMVMGHLVTIAYGATSVFPAASFEPLPTLEALHEERCTALHGVPTMFINQLDHPQMRAFDLSQLRTGLMAGALCPEELMKRLMSEMNMSEILIAYGQTELGPINHLTLADDSMAKRTQTVGRALPQLEIKLVDDQGKVVAVGERGEVCTRGYSVLQCYWNDEEKTAEAIDGARWFHSGDLGVMDEDGYLRIVGRIKDMIIRGGENIYPAEVEDFLYTHLKISDVQVFGVPDKVMGEEVCAWVRLKEGESMSEHELKEFCKGKIAHFKIPSYVRFVEEYPMTVTGKIKKMDMSAAMAKALQEEAVLT